MLGSTQMFIQGIPVPKGSKRVYMVSGRPVLADVNSKNLRAWESLITLKIKNLNIQYPGMVRVYLTFYFPKPAKPKYLYPPRPDIDKATRSVYDALTKSGVIKDDSLIVSGSSIKLYASTTLPPGVHIEITPV